MTRIDARPRSLPVPKIAMLLCSVALQFAAAAAPEAEDNTTLVPDLRDVAALDVSIAVFDPGVPADQSIHRDLQVFPLIREIEAKLLPFVLRESLANTGAWGAVRVVPQLDVAAELLVSGTIVRSDGDTLELQIRVVDASGRIWLDKLFVGVVSDDDAQHDNESGVPGHQKLYDDIEQGLRLTRSQLDKEALSNVAEISLLRYANELAPSAFGDYLTIKADGTVALRRLPARNDPMLDRIQRIRSTEYVITDTVDAKFRELHSEIASIYDVWREYRRKVVDYEAENARWVKASKSDAPRGSYEAIKNHYDAYKWDRLAAQEQDRLAVAFDNEVGPTIRAMESRVAELEAWVEQKYAEWHRLLEELFEVETRLEDS